MFRPLAVFLFLMPILLISCRSEELIRPGDSLEVAYEKAYSLYEEERWRDAIQSFETVLSLGRGTSIGQDAQFYMAESYYNNNQFLLAADEYERYSGAHPNSPRREIADYKNALSYYQLSPRYNIDQTNSRRSIELFQLYLARYPNSSRVDEVSAMVDEMLDKLARKQYESAEFYMRNNQFRAATIYYELVIDRYPGSAWAERALVSQIDAFIQYADNSIPDRRQERYEEALASYQTYLQLFPRGENRSRAEELYDIARERLQAYDGEPVTERR
ncbi:MAG: outer membrane protein assembly factor BamD [Balneolaceae bacterium]